jgi:hypothetical protein
MKSSYSRLSGLAALFAATGLYFGEIEANAQTSSEIPPILVTPDTVDTRIGTLNFKDGAPSAETVNKVYETLDFTRGLDVFLNSSAVHQLTRSVKACWASAREDNTVTIYPELMD